MVVTVYERDNCFHERIPYSKNNKANGASFRRNDSLDCLTKQALLTIV